jgi:hypothetical protein
MRPHTRLSGCEVTTRRVSITPSDTIAALAILLSLIAYVTFHQRGAAFYGGDASYLALARSVRAGGYTFNFRRETMLPPGFPAILALLIGTIGESHATLICAMAVFLALGLGASYLLMRREEGARFAAYVMVVMCASPVIFRMTTAGVMSDVPYLLTSMTTLVLAGRMAARSSLRPQGVMQSIACAALLFASVLIRSAGITLILGIVAWLFVSFIVAREDAIKRCRVFVLVLTAGLLAQGAWMYWVHRNELAAEWPIGGYPQSYVAQLRVRNGNEPELGYATPADIPKRILGNLEEQTVGLVELTTGKGGRLPHKWFTPWVFIPVPLILIGLWKSIQRRGGAPHDWYFVAHQAMYLLWPWDFEIRFIVPVAPLACLYLYRGGRTLAEWVTEEPQRIAQIVLRTALFFGAVATAYGWQHPGLRAKAAVAPWLSLAVGIMAYRRLSVRFTNGETSRIWTLGPTAALAAILVVDGASVAATANANLTFDLTRQPTYQQIVAAKWLASHTPRATIIMARQMDVVNLYSGRKVVWFPPISNPDILLDGIRAHHVGYVLVFDRGPDTYWRPAEGDCFANLVRRYPEAFALVQQGPFERIYAVTNELNEE